MSKKDRCSICAHKKRKQIDQCVTDGVSYRNIAEKFHVGFQSVKRHVDKGHIAEDIKAAAIENGINRGILLQNKLDTAYDLALDAAKKAKKQDLRAFGGCISGVLLFMPTTAVTALLYQLNDMVGPVSAIKSRNITA